MRVFFGGDFIPHDAHARRISDAREYVDSDVFAAADLRVVNLECPILPARAPLARPSRVAEAEAPMLGVYDPSCDALRLLQIGAVVLANNHLFDHGEEGAAATLRHLRAAGIAHVGAGMSEQDAHRPLPFDDQWGLWAYCHAHPIHLRGVPFARGEQPGVAELTVAKVFRDLDAATAIEHAVLYVHWGRESSCLPLPGVVALAETLLRHPKVRLIIGAHPHRLQGIRRTRDGVVGFSLGHLHMPGFVIAPPLRMDGFDRGQLPITRSFHEVRTRTFKAWPARARLSVGLSLNTTTRAVRAVPLWQADRGTHTRELHGLAGALAQTALHAAGALSRAPAALLRMSHRAGGLAAYVNYLHWLARHNGTRAAADAVRTLLQSNR